MLTYGSPIPQALGLVLVGLESASEWMLLPWLSMTLTRDAGFCGLLTMAIGSK